MKPCIICTIKHVASAELFAHEALAGYGIHITDAFGELDHAEMEIMNAWPAVADFIHKEKKIIGDAIDTDNLQLLRTVDFVGLKTLLLAVEGKWNILKFNPNNSKQYALDHWIEEGMMIRFEAGLPNPDWFYDKLYRPMETEVYTHARNNGNLPELEREELDDLGPEPDFFDLLGPDNA